MALFDDLQRAFDNRSPVYDDSEQIKEEEKQQLIGRKIEIIEQDAENYGDMAVDAIAEYLINEDGIPDDIMWKFKGVIIESIMLPNDNDVNEFINSAIEWKAKQIVNNAT